MVEWDRRERPQIQAACLCRVWMLRPLGKSSLPVFCAGRPNRLRGSPWKSFCNKTKLALLRADASRASKFAGWELCTVVSKRLDEFWREQKPVGRVCFIRRRREGSIHRLTRNRGRFLPRLNSWACVGGIPWKKTGAFKPSPRGHFSSGWLMWNRRAFAQTYGSPSFEGCQQLKNYRDP